MTPVRLGATVSEQNVVEELILQAGGWERFTYYDDALGTQIKVVERELDEGDPEGRYYDSNHEQGHEGEIFIVFEVNGKFWRKEGTTDSYAKRSWDGKFREVQRGEVKVTKYEWTEA